LTEIGFYHLTRTPLEQALPRLLEKAYAAGQRVVLRAIEPARLEQLDAVLWTYGQGSFLPHGTRADGRPEQQPIFLTTDPSDNPNGARVLVLVDGAPFGDLASYERCLDLFDGNSEAAVAAARERWRWGREQGHRLVYWRQDERGGWVKAREEDPRPDGG
jgi:DNA polymerase-3 subunit chi